MEAAQAGQVDDEVSCRGSFQALAAGPREPWSFLERLRCQWQRFKMMAGPIRGSACNTERPTSR